MRKDEQNDPLVSVCMPAYNAGNFIREAVNSVLVQTYSNLELVIVNDGSTDNTLEILQSLNDRRITVLSSTNKGQSAAANLAYRNSSGELIKFMDADDLISEHFIKSQVGIIRNDENVIASASWGRFYHNDLKTFKLKEEMITAPAEPIEWLATSMNNKQIMLQSARWLIPRPMLERAGLWKEELSLINDFEFFIRLLLTAKEIRYAPEAVLYYRSGLDTSLSGSKSRKAAESAFNAIDWGSGHMLRHENSGRIRTIAADCFQRFIYDFYPHYPDILKKAKLKVRQLGGSRIPFLAGGYTRKMVRFLGWRATKKIKLFIYKLKRLART
jgi:glycosyltransferase involved in cell wall biosynthesis